MERRKHLNRGYSRAIAADEIFDNFVTGIIERGGYVEATDLSSSLGDAVTLSRIPSFRSILEYNKRVDAAIDVYWNSKCIRTFTELEVFVINSICKWKKIEEVPSSFEEFGLGRLSSNSKVVKLFAAFGSPDMLCLERVSTKQIIDCFSNFLSTNKGIVVDLEGQAEMRFQKFLDDYFKQGPISGVNVDFRALFYAFKGVRFDKQIAQHIRDAKFNVLNTLKKGLSESISAHISRNSTTLLVSLESKIFASESAKMSLLHWKLAFESLNGFDQFVNIFSNWLGVAAIETLGSTSQSMQLNSMRWLEDLRDALENHYMLRYSSADQPNATSSHIVGFSIAALVNLLINDIGRLGNSPQSFELAAAGTDSSISDATACDLKDSAAIFVTLDENIRQALKKQSMSDVPSFALNALSNFVTGYLLAPELISLQVGDDGLCTGVDYDLRAAAAIVELRLAGSVVKRPSGLGPMNSRASKHASELNGAPGARLVVERSSQVLDCRPGVRRRILTKPTQKPKMEKYVCTICSNGAKVGILKTLKKHMKRSHPEIDASSSSATKITVAYPKPLVEELRRFLVHNTSLTAEAASIAFNTARKVPSQEFPCRLKSLKALCDSYPDLLEWHRECVGSEREGECWIRPVIVSDAEAATKESRENQASKGHARSARSAGARADTDGAADGAVNAHSENEGEGDATAEESSLEIPLAVGNCGLAGKETKVNEVAMELKKRYVCIVCNDNTIYNSRPQWMKHMATFHKESDRNPVLAERLLPPLIELQVLLQSKELATHLRDFVVANTELPAERALKAFKATRPLEEFVMPTSDTTAKKWCARHPELLHWHVAGNSEKWILPAANSGAVSSSDRDSSKASATTMAKPAAGVSKQLAFSPQPAAVVKTRRDGDCEGDDGALVDRGGGSGDSDSDSDSDSDTGSESDSDDDESNDSNGSDSADDEFKDLLGARARSSGGRAGAERGGASTDRADVTDVLSIPAAEPKMMTSCRILPPDVFLALATGALLYLRIERRERQEAVASTPGKRERSAVAMRVKRLLAVRTARVSADEVQAQGPTLAVMNFLMQAEARLNLTVRVPAFDCLGFGSFLSFLVGQDGRLLSDVFAACDEVIKANLAVAHGSKDSDRDDEFDSDSMSLLDDLNLGTMPVLEALGCSSTMGLHVVNAKGLEAGSDVQREYLLADWAASIEASVDDMLAATEQWHDSSSSSSSSRILPENVSVVDALRVLESRARALMAAQSPHLSSGELSGGYGRRGVAFPGTPSPSFFALLQLASLQAQAQGIRPKLEQLLLRFLGVNIQSGTKFGGDDDGELGSILSYSAIVPKQEPGSGMQHGRRHTESTRMIAWPDNKTMPLVKAAARSLSVHQQRQSFNTMAREVDPAHREEGLAQAKRCLLRWFNCSPEAASRILTSDSDSASSEPYEPSSTFLTGTPSLGQSAEQERKSFNELTRATTAFKRGPIIPLLVFDSGDEAVVHSHPSTAATTDQDHCSDLDADIVAEAVALMAMVPYGASCAEFLRWHDLVALSTLAPMSSTCSRSQWSILAFVVSHELELRDKMIGTVLVAAPNSRGEDDDCFPLPTKSPTREDISKAMEVEDFAYLASICLSAELMLLEPSPGHTSAMECSSFRYALKAVLLERYEASGGAGALQTLLRVAIGVSFSLPRKYAQRRLMKMWMKKLSEIAEVTTEMVERFAVDVARGPQEIQQQQQQQTSHTTATSTSTLFSISAATNTKPQNGGDTEEGAAAELLPRRSDTLTSSSGDLGGGNEQLLNLLSLGVQSPREFPYLHTFAASYYREGGLRATKRFQQRGRNGGDIYNDLSSPQTPGMAANDMTTTEQAAQAIGCSDGTDSAITQSIHGDEHAVQECRAQVEQLSEDLISPTAVALIVSGLPPPLESIGEEKGTKAAEKPHGVAADSAMDDAISSKRAFIEKLLQSEFQYDALGNRPSVETPEGRKLRQSLDLLSASLYSSDVHFVMELIQNADDNVYDPLVIPALKIQLFPHAVVVFNNEVGFEDRNIVAICNVGGSTKKGQSGYIGQKGIGFKSVFSVSDFPEVHSKGFHIQFNRARSMLEPIWIEESATSKWPPKVDPKDGTHYETCFRLKLDDNAMKAFPKLTQNLEEAFDEKLILFLNKVQRMVFEDKSRSGALVEHRKAKLCEAWTHVRAIYQNCHPRKAHTLATVSLNQRSATWKEAKSSMPPFNASASLQRAPSAGASSGGGGSVAIVDSYWLTRQRRLENLSVRRNGVKVSATELSIAFKFSRVVDSPAGEGTAGVSPSLAAPSSEGLPRLLADANYLHGVSDGGRHDDESAGDSVNGEGSAPEPIEQCLQSSGARGLLRLDLSEGMLPVYAFLPTLTSSFKFIIQGDFLLSTSRESILDNNDWNRMLLEHIPSLFIESLKQISAWVDLQPSHGCTTHVGASTSPRLPLGDAGTVAVAVVSGDQHERDHTPGIANDEARLVVDGDHLLAVASPKDVLDLLPRKSLAAKVFTSVIDSIYLGLTSEDILRSRSGRAASPSQLFAVHHLRVDPGVYISEEMVAAATGRRFVLHDENFQLDDEIADALMIPKFNIEAIFDILRYIEAVASSGFYADGDKQEAPRGPVQAAKSTGNVPAKSSSTRKSAAVERIDKTREMKQEYLQMLAGVLMLLDLLCSELQSAKLLGNSATRATMAGAPQAENRSGSFVGGGGGGGGAGGGSGGSSSGGIGSASASHVGGNVATTRWSTSDSVASNRAAPVPAGRLSRDMVGRLKSLRIWLLSTGKCVKLSGSGSDSGNSVVFIRRPSARCFSEAQDKCFQVFKDRLLLLDEQLFSAASRISVLNSLPVDGDQAVAQFLLINFRSSVANTCQPGAPGVPGSQGGIGELCPEVIIEAIILPAYDAYFSQQADMEVCHERRQVKASDSPRGKVTAIPDITDPSNRLKRLNRSEQPEQSSSLDRATAGAFLAFLFLSSPLPTMKAGLRSDRIGSELARLMKGRNAIAPLLCINAWNRSESSWSYGGLQTLQPLEGVGIVRVPPPVEVHLGLEVRDSATNELLALPGQGQLDSLQCLQWPIVDPLVAAFAFNKVDVLLGRSSPRSRKKQPMQSSTGHTEKAAAVSVGESGREYQTPLPPEAALLQQQLGELKTQHIRSTFSSCSEDEVNSWRAFLMHMGVVDFFGFYRWGTPSRGVTSNVQQSGREQAPLLFKTLRHLLRTATVVSACQSAWSIPDTSHTKEHLTGVHHTDYSGVEFEFDVGNAGKAEKLKSCDLDREIFYSEGFHNNEVGDEMGDEMGDGVGGEVGDGVGDDWIERSRPEYYLPLYLRHSCARNASPQSKRVLMVKSDVYGLMVQVAAMIARDIEFHSKQKGASDYLEDLNMLPWLPVMVHPLALNTFAELRYEDSFIRAPSTATRTATAFAAVTAIPIASRDSSRDRQQFFFLAAPRDVFARQEDRERGEYLLGPHCVYVPHKIYDLKAYPSLKRHLQLNLLSSRGEPEVSVLAGLMCWMSRQEHSHLLCSIGFMSWVYQTLFKKLDVDTDEDWDSESDSAAITRLLENEKPILWICDSIDDANARVDDYKSGRMLPLSRVVKEDKVEWLRFDASPIKDISLFYKGKYTATVDLFTRSSYCLMCQTIEGMFGVSGMHLGSAAASSGASSAVAAPAASAATTASQAPPGTAAAERAANIPISRYPAGCTSSCSCDNEGFGKLLKKPGSIFTRKSLSLQQAIEVMKYFRDLVVESKSPATRGEALRQLHHILLTTSSNIWKCFNIKRCLHPYGVEQLQEFIQAMRTEALLPVMIQSGAEGNKFTSAVSMPEARLIAVDDPSLMALFEANPSPAGAGTASDTGKVTGAGTGKVIAQSIVWISQSHMVGAGAEAGAGAADGGSRTRNNVAVIRSRIDSLMRMESIAKDTGAGLSLDGLAADISALLRLPREQFSAAVSTIPPATFFAPQSLQPLLQLLQIPSLSEHTTCRWSHRPTRKKTDKADKFVQLTNSLLFVAQTYLSKIAAEIWHPMVHQRVRGLAADLIAALRSSHRLRMIEDMRVVSCSALTRHITSTLLDSTNRSVVETKESFQLRQKQSQPAGADVGAVAAVNAARDGGGAFEVAFAAGDTVVDTLNGTALGDSSSGSGLGSGSGSGLGSGLGSGSGSVLESLLGSGSGSGLELLLNEDLIDEEELTELSVLLIMGAVRVEIASLTLNQHADKMAAMEQLLRKFSTASIEAIPELLKFEGLLQFTPVATERIAQCLRLGEPLLQELGGESESARPPGGVWRLAEATQRSLQQLGPRSVERQPQTTTNRDDNDGDGDVGDDEGDRVGSTESRSSGAGLSIGTGLKGAVAAGDELAIKGYARLKEETRQHNLRRAEAIAAGTLPRRPPVLAAAGAAEGESAEIAAVEEAAYKKYMAEKKRITAEEAELALKALSQSDSAISETLGQETTTEAFHGDADVRVVTYAAQPYLGRQHNVGEAGPTSLGDQGGRIDRVLIDVTQSSPQRNMVGVGVGAGMGVDLAADGISHPAEARLQSRLANSPSNTQYWVVGRNDTCAVDTTTRSSSVPPVAVGEAPVPPVAVGGAPGTKLKQVGFEAHTAHPATTGEGQPQQRQTADAVSNRRTEKEDDNDDDDDGFEVVMFKPAFLGRPSCNVTAGDLNADGTFEDTHNASKANPTAATSLLNPSPAGCLTASSPPRSAAMLFAEALRDFVLSNPQHDAPNAWALFKVKMTESTPEDSEALRSCRSMKAKKLCLLYPQLLSWQDDIEADGRHGKSWIRAVADEASTGKHPQGMLSRETFSETAAAATAVMPATPVAAAAAAAVVDAERSKITDYSRNTNGGQHATGHNIPPRPNQRSLLGPSPPARFGSWPGGFGPTSATASNSESRSQTGSGCVEVSISNEDLQLFIDREINSAPPGRDQPDVAAAGSPSNGEADQEAHHLALPTGPTSTGRIGESIAFACLKKALLTSRIPQAASSSTADTDADAEAEAEAEGGVDVVIAQSARLGLSKDGGAEEDDVVAVRWVNEQSETGLPFDIEIRFANGERKFCEVKTKSMSDKAGHSHSYLQQQSSGAAAVAAVAASSDGAGAREGADVPRAVARLSQWPISPAEIRFAYDQGDAFFCVLIGMLMDHETRSVSVSRIVVVGYDGGLMKALALTQAHLLLQINTS